ncbi:ABC transporter permease [Rossellomorea sp. YZS02]|uniref:ABC transporter permease n=1 Tax=Rossellomorea sp. YZS02 TaxID=3097358 RepID=UPI002A0D8400|nr:ABC transporter permease [Rossellomorea sp. YZS02]MDX8343225.1 ABC transporter permease [Rossellomorea sp. YZS02]
MMNLITNELIKQTSHSRMWISLALIVFVDAIASIFVYLLFDGIQFSFWEYMRISSNLLIIIQLFSLIIAGDIVSSEFSSGTIKLLLIRPIHRVKILLSKYITVLVIATVLTASHFLFSAVLGSLWFYDSFFDLNENFFIVAGAYVLRFIEMLVVCSFAFTFSVVTRSSSFAIGSTIFLTFSGSALLMLMNERGLEWGRYLLFANTDLQQYFFGTPPFEGMTFWFSVVVIAVYLVGFGGLCWWSFGRRDVDV